VQTDVTLTFAPFFHTGGWNVLTTPFLHRGGHVILLSKFDPEQVLQLCDSEGVTVLFGVPTMMDMMEQADGFFQASLESVRYAIVGGEPMPVELIRTWQDKGVPIRQGYGLTEFGPNVFSLNEEDAIRKIGSIGFPNFYIDTRVVDDDGSDVTPGDVGELLLRGPVCTPGYWNNPEATASTIRNGWLYTGDLVRADGEGYFYVVDRKKEMYISGAENVYPAEVESFLRTHPGILAVAVIGVPDERWGEVGKAFVVLKEGMCSSEDEIVAYCRGNLAKYKIPKHVVFLDALPVSDSGKILKKQLRQQYDGR
jgi:fatty-acyl-CoA synthase